MLEYNEKSDRKDVTPQSSHIMQLKYNNPEGDSSIGFRYSKYRDSDASKNELDSDFLQKNIDRKAATFWKQTKLMTWKNFLVFSRNLKPTIFQMLTPVIICLILLTLQGLVNNFSEDLIDKNPKIISLDKLEKCVYPEDCVTIGYGIIVNLYNY